MQDSLFPEPDDIPHSPARASRAPKAKVQAAQASAELLALGRKLPPNLRLGTSSWSYPGWIGSVWDREYPDATLARHGLRAYAQHPLLRAVSLDRAFYRALSVAQYVTYAAQVPSDFRFIVKAPALVCDAQTRDEAGRAFQANSGFLDPELALRTFAQPAVEGLGTAIAAGASVYVWWAGRELRPE